MTLISYPLRKFLGSCDFPRSWAAVLSTIFALPVIMASEKYHWNMDKGDFL